MLLSSISSDASRPTTPNLWAISFSTTLPGSSRVSDTGSCQTMDSILNSQSTGIWQVIKGWMDPVVVSKVHFTKSVEDVEKFVPRSDIPKSMGGDDDYEYEYVDPVPGENDKMKDAATRDSLLAVRLQHAQDFQDATIAWLTAPPGENKELKEKRHAIAEKLRENYWRLDPYVRARAMVDRQGFLQSPYAAKPAAGSKPASVSEKINEVVTTKPVTAEVNAN